MSATYSVIKVYGITELSDYKNWFIEDIATFLSTKTPAYTESDHNFIKHSLNIVLTLPISKSVLNYENNTLNYVSIQNGLEKTVYYYVNSKEWTSDDAVRFNLRMDTLNTFPLGSSYNASPETHITREHKNFFGTSLVRSQNFARTFTSPGSLFLNRDALFGLNNDCTSTNDVTIYITSDPTFASFTITKNTEGGKFSGVTINVTQIGTLSGEYTVTFYLTYSYTTVTIDDFPEGIQPVLYNRKEKNISSGENLNWYLMYRNAEDQESEAVECFLVPETPIKVNIPASGSIITWSNIGAYTFYCCDPFAQGTGVNSPENFTISLFDGNNDLIQTLQTNVSYSAQYQYFVSGLCTYFLIEKKTSPTLNVKQITRMFEYYPEQGYIDWGNAQIIKDINCVKFSFSAGIVTCAASNNASYLPFTNATTPSDLSNYYLPRDPDTDTVDTACINDIDRTDSKLLKIIALPYLPIDLTSTNGVYNINGIFEVTNNLLKFIDINLPFNYSLNADVIDPAKILLPKNSPSGSSSLRVRDPKTFRSEYFCEKLVYDSFSIDLPLENRKKTFQEINNLNIDYAVTKTINSRFMFSAKNWVDNERGKAIDNYPGRLIVARNNEITLYNSAYLNYIRNGYNYDVKAKDRAIVSTLIGGAAGIATGAVQLGTGQSFGAMTILSSLNSTIQSVAAAEDSIARKMTETQSQAISVSGSDDIDLLQIYSGNRAKIVQYQCSDIMLRAIDDLFYFCGYACDKYGAPQMDAKLHFDFCQCSLIFGETTDYIPDACKADIQRRFAEGVTKFHKIGTNTYYFAQTENNNKTTHEYSITANDNYKYPDIPL